jgi:hypothetical protein
MLWAMGFKHLIASISGTAASLALLCAAAGCNGRPANSGFDEAVAGGEKAVAMRGQSLFWNGKIGVTVTLSKGVGVGSKTRKFKAPDPDSVLNSADDQEEAVAYIIARGNLGSPMAPITIHLKLENRTDQAVKVQVLEMNSDLGNFAVTPDSLVLSAGQTAEPDPMISQLGVISDSVPFKVTLNIAGKNETQTIVARDITGSNGAASLGQ